MPSLLSIDDTIEKRRKENSTNSLNRMTTYSLNKSLESNIQNGIEEEKSIEDYQQIEVLKYRHAYKQTSLSTISEERTSIAIDSSTLNATKQANLNSMNSTLVTNTSASLVNVSTNNGLSILQNVINEFYESSALISNIMKVFEPSSKHGCFNRNIPIRLTSPASYKYLNSPINSPQTSTTSQFTNQNNFQSVNRHIEKNELRAICSLGSKFADNRKYRFVKRLKKTLENKRGIPLIADVKRINVLNFGLEYEIERVPEKQTPKAKYNEKCIKLLSDQLFNKEIDANNNNFPQFIPFNRCSSLRKSIKPSTPNNFYAASNDYEEINTIESNTLDLTVESPLFTDNSVCSENALNEYILESGRIKTPNITSIMF
jgi:hypothetical protein